MYCLIYCQPQNNVRNMLMTLFSHRNSLMLFDMFCKELMFCWIISFCVKFYQMLILVLGVYLLFLTKIGYNHFHFRLFDGNWKSYNLYNHKNYIIILKSNDYEFTAIVWWITIGDIHKYMHQYTKITIYIVWGRNNILLLQIV